ncbi:MAG: putative aminopeptidase [Anaerolineales bacterium]|nr:putative aminopeptidase [Anaerolineales bacterium]
MAKKPVRKAAPKPRRPAARLAPQRAKAPARDQRPQLQPLVRPPKATASEMDLLRELCHAIAVSGDEGAVRRIVLDAIRDHVDEVKVDALGNVLAVKRSKRSSQRTPRLLVAAHMDEVGFMLTGHESDGSLRFELVGGVEEHTLLGKPVLVGPKRLPGVIGAAPVHLLKDDRRNAVTKVSQMRIDIGVDSADAAKRWVKMGERGGFTTEFAVVGPSLRGKALDNRLGCATLIELLRAPAVYDFDLHAAFTVQEEVGLRGARVVGYAVDPACAFVLDCTPARDLPSSDDRENTQYNSRLGLGPAIYISDRGMISNDRLVRYLQQTADAAGLPYQFRQPGGGGTDAGAIHLAREGVPTVSVSVPGRYPHSPVMLARTEDWRNTVKLMRLALENWTPQVLKR